VTAGCDGGRAITGMGSELPLLPVLLLAAAEAVGGALAGAGDADAGAEGAGAAAAGEADGAGIAGAGVTGGTGSGRIAGVSFGGSILAD
jgi:hypothetical protein